MYKKIMVPLDGSELAECVLPHIKTIVKGATSPEVVIVQAVEPFSVPYGIGVSQFASLEEIKAFGVDQEAEAKKYLKKITARLKKAGIKARAEVIHGRACEALIDYANKNDIDLVIIATHGRSGISRWVWGSVAERLLRSICVPVLMVRAPGSVPDTQQRE